MKNIRVKNVRSMNLWKAIILVDDNSDESYHYYWIFSYMHCMRLRVLTQLSNMWQKLMSSAFPRFAANTTNANINASYNRMVSSHWFVCWMHWFYAGVNVIYTFSIELYHTLHDIALGMPLFAAVARHWPPLTSLSTSSLSLSKCSQRRMCAWRGSDWVLETRGDNRQRFVIVCEIIGGCRIIFCRYSCCSGYCFCCWRLLCCIQ